MVGALHPWRAVAIVEVDVDVVVVVDVSGHPLVADSSPCDPGSARGTSGSSCFRGIAGSQVIVHDHDHVHVYVHDHVATGMPDTLAESEWAGDRPCPRRAP